MSEIRVDTISERTNANGVTIDGLTIKDGAITSTAASTITVADNSDNLTLTSTDADENSGPNLRLYRNSANPAVGDNLGQIDFEGRNDNSQDVVYASMMARARDETDGTEDGGIQLDVMKDGSLTGLWKYYSDGTTSEFSINDDSIDMDFRVESNGNTHMLFVDGGENRTGIGTGTPQAQFDLTVPNAKTASAGVWGYLGKTNEGSGYGALQCFQVGHANAASRQWQFQTIEQGVANDGIITLQLSGGNVAIGRSTADAKLDVSGGIRTSSGILFGTDTAAANTLDDYEEGTWTPILVSDATAAAYTSQTGVYTKIGRMVYINCQVRMSDVGSFAGATTQINGLPFTSSNNSTDNIGVLYMSGTASVVTNSYVRIPGNSAFLRLEEGAGTTGVDNSLNANHLDTGTTVRFSMVYFT